MIRTLLLLLALAAPAAAQELIHGDGVEGRAADQEEEEAIVRVQAGLSSDPAAADELALRMLKSKLEARFEGEDARQKLAAIRAWIDTDPRSAAEIAVGLARDDASGTHEFEDMLSFRASRTLQYNPDSKKGLLGRLKKTNKDSKLMKKDEEMADEEKAEIIKTLFEGQGGQSNQILTQTKGEGDKGTIIRSAARMIWRATSFITGGQSRMIMGYAAFNSCAIFASRRFFPNCRK